MNKLSRLRKMLVRHAVILLIAVTLLAALAFGVTTYNDSKTEEAAKLKGNLSLLNNQVQDLEKKIGVVKTSLDMFNELKKRLDEGKYAINREAAAKTLDTMRGEFQLSAFLLEISTEMPTEDPELTKFSKLAVSSSLIKIGFTAISDVYVYAFLEALPERLPGFLRVSSMKMSRKEKLSDEVIQGARKGQVPTLISAEVNLLWIGVKTKPDASAPPVEDPAPGGPPSGAPVQGQP